MATFYPNTSAQVDVLSTPYGQDQKFTSYSESPIIHNHGNMMMYLNGASSNGSFSEVAPESSMAGRNEMMFIPPTSDHISMQNIGGQSNANAMHALTEEMLLTSRSQLSVVDGERNFHGLSLSLSTQLSTTLPPASYEQFSSKDWPYDLHGEGQNSMRFGVPNTLQGVGYSVNQYEQGGAARTIMKSRFLRATQQLLDEVVSVQDALKQHESGKDRNVKKVEDGPSESKDKSSDVNESATALGQELSATERQDLQNKLDKFVAMLEEVDRRYKQYYHQMQILVSSFELVAGCGTAKPYTTLASKTISRHFRTLRDAISAQIQATRKSLGEQDSGQGVIPRLRFVDQQLRQQRALQQFGMMRHAWRPQRGLPENAVTALRAWLFEHFLNPYPKDSEKIMLARQTGLTRGQVTNWFINARVRLWKPMVEEMYKEEFGEADLNLKSSPENAVKAAGETSMASEDRREELQESFRIMGESGHTGPSHDESKANYNHHNAEMNQSVGRSGMMVSPQGGDDKHKGVMKLYENHQSMNNHGFYTNDQSGLMSFQVPELGSYGVNNQVSLALGLRRIDGDVGHTTMRPGTSAENEVGPEAGEYSYFGQVSQQHKFGNSHLLDDFVV